MSSIPLKPSEKRYLALTASFWRFQGWLTGKQRGEIKQLESILANGQWADGLQAIAGTMFIQYTIKKIHQRKTIELLN